MIENQEELRGALEKVKDLEKTLSELESKLQVSEQTSGQQIHELQEQVSHCYISDLTLGMSCS